MVFSHIAIGQETFFLGYVSWLSHIISLTVKLALRWAFSFSY